MPKTTFPLKLGIKWSEEMKPSLAMSESKEDFHYPGLHIEKRDGEGYSFPDEGTMTVRFLKTGESSNTRDGKTRASCDLDILEIVKVTSEDKEDTRATLDRLKKEVETAKDESEDEDY